ncbi:putative factor involved in sulfur-containing coenzyme synthesis [[Clostridium] ultunense Esp]|uniref:tRNA threonylcarbamoyladenosine dehydratase (T(6)A37 dehydratase) n=1 Tax=[Clostridium] ultunense Esp TaxID=1288971 RepID=M1YZI9_9FIRM|nr:tRNA threonylcarbamoyladenosine dehydratase [Schnuerera ultunensis]CCQ96015.1 putative factor involved in sulfur-containing coenzyme synthesis [[Clostridium] ultunense Esp]SHD76907.1 tRNA threonylcarbamoyladenosine dehydratase (t(6)A37 dehydratase) [[Clostridium] ultunense Esp]
MDSRFSRTELLLGKDGIEILKNSRVAVFGVGGVGSFASEALVRSGLGEIIIVDYDIIDITNINRQIHATSKTVGFSKVEVMKERLLEINPNLNIRAVKDIYKEENKDRLLSSDYDYVIDAIDMISAKINLIENCKRLNIPIISCMGAGNKLNPTLLQVGDIYETNTCPLAKVMRNKLRKRNIQDLKVVWSTEKPIKVNLEKEGARKAVPGSVSFVPSVAGLILASEVVKDLVYGGVSLWSN